MQLNVEVLIIICLKMIPLQLLISTILKFLSIEYIIYPMYYLKYNRKFNIYYFYLKFCIEYYFIYHNN